MAGGKQSARQKMINLMYLVFIAMLAMNMSKEVLSAFGFVNEKLTESNVSTTARTKVAYESLATKAKEQAAKFDALNKKAIQIKNYSTSFYAYVEDLKTKMTAEVEDKKNYEAMDKTHFLDAYFFKGDNYSKEGQEFIDKINGYKTDLNGVLGEGNSYAPLLTKRFSTLDVTNKDDKKIKWLDYRFKGFPLVASLTNLTQLQADIKNTEGNIVEHLLGGQVEKEASLNNYKGIVRLDKTAYFAGERVKGQVVLGRYDATLVPNKVTLNGADATGNVKDGQVMIDMSAGNVGEKSIKGTIFFTENGEEVPVEFESKYSVIAEPSSAVVSADKMNVVYRGLDNPISVSLPGVGDNNLNVSASGGRLSGGKGKYVIKPGAGKVVSINVSAKLSSGKTVNSKATFRIKNIPPASGAVRGQFGTVRMPKSSLGNVQLTAGFEDFDFDLKLSVKSFKIKVPGKLTVIVNGNKMTSAAKKAFSKARRGDMIHIFDIKATKSDGGKIPKVRNVTIEITN